MSKELRRAQTARAPQTPQQRQHVVLQIIQPGLAGLMDKFFASNFWISAIEVIVGGSLVFAAGVIIGRS
ncbi:MAG TPA: hypothetical protein VFO29_08970 [Candidatus Rubrimentiphilum sp.]|nr:hypothetical protein [Candidatus Rubrimentiphilum sp.]